MGVKSEESADQEPPERIDTTVNQVLGDPDNVVQFRDLHGNFSIGAHSDNDVELLLQPEQREVVVDVRDKCRVIPLTVRSHLSQQLTVELSLRGAPTPRWTIEPREVTVHPGVPEVAALRLPCTATEPHAGPKHLRVVARQRDGKREWQSEPPVTVTVQPEPGLAVKPKVTPDVLRSGEQTIAVTVRNTGNTRLEGSLVRWASASDAGYLPTDAVELPQGGISSFQLDPGQTVERLFVVTLPPPEMTARKWYLPIAAQLDGAEHPCAVPELLVTQLGWLTQIPDYARRLTRWGQVEHGPYRRATLAISAVAVFVAGLLVGANVFPSQSPGEETVATSPPSSQIAATPSVPPLFAPVRYEKMACTAGTSVVYLASMTKQEADEYSAYFVQREVNRMKALKPPLSQLYTIRVTARSDLCPTVRRQLDEKPKMKEYSTFIWISVPTSEASATCKNLDHNQIFDCSTVPIN